MKVTEEKGIGSWRIVLVGLLLLFGNLPVYTETSHWPNFLFAPAIGLHAFFATGFPSVFWVKAISIFQVICLALWALVPKARRWAALGLVFCLVWGLGYQYALGKTDHGYVLLGGFFLIEFLFPKTYFGNQTMPRWKNPLAVFFVFLYFTAGFGKLLGGWLTSPESITAFVLQSDGMLPKSLTDLILKLGKFPDYAVALWELSFPLFLLNRRVFAFSLGSAVLFHLVVSLTLNISFAENIWCAFWFLPLSLAMEMKYARFVKIFVVAISAVLVCMIASGSLESGTSFLTLFMEKYAAEQIGTMLLTISFFGLYAFRTQKLPSHSLF